MPYADICLVKWYQAVVVTVFIASIQACGSKPLILPGGTTLSYDLVMNQKPVRLTAKVEQFNPQLVFDYNVENEGIKGRFTVTQEALMVGTEIDHLFTGEAKTLTKTTSLRISDSTFHQLKNDGEAILSFRQGFLKNENIYKVVDNQTTTINFNDKPKTVDVLYLEDIHGKEFKFWIWDNPKNPIIIRMDVGWQMLLKNIETTLD